MTAEQAQGPDPSPAWVGDEKWKSIVMEAVKLRQIANEPSVRVLVGEHASALDLFAHVVEAGFFCPQILLRDPWLDPVRSERRFNTIVARARERSQDAEAEFRRLGGDQLLSLS